MTKMLVDFAYDVEQTFGTGVGTFAYDERQFDVYKQFLCRWNTYLRHEDVDVQSLQFNNNNAASRVLALYSICLVLVNRRKRILHGETLTMDD